MKYLLLILALPMLAATDCGKKKTSSAAGVNSTGKDSILPCLRRMIDSAANEMPPTIPVQIDEYLHAGKTVYYVTADCCDFYNVVYDTDCKYICAPGGGFTGRGDGKCPDFFKEATLVRTIWKKEDQQAQKK